MITTLLKNVRYVFETYCATSLDRKSTHASCPRARCHVANGPVSNDKILISNLYTYLITRSYAGSAFVICHALARTKV